MVMLQRQQHEEELYELQKQKLQEEKRKECWEQLKHKRKDEESKHKTNYAFVMYYYKLCLQKAETAVWLEKGAV